MRIIGWERVERLVRDDSYQFKIVVNEQGPIFLPASEQHCDATAEGISYCDDYRGVALAGDNYAWEDRGPPSRGVQ